MMIFCLLYHTIMSCSSNLESLFFPHFIHIYSFNNVGLDLCTSIKKCSQTWLEICSHEPLFMVFEILNCTLATQQDQDTIERWKKRI